MTLPGPDAEWLEADGLGGFSSGSVVGPRTRRYHALLLTAVTPPTGRYVLVNGFDAFVETEQGRYALTAQRYSLDAVSPDGDRRLTGFAPDLWPRFSFALEDGTRLEHEVFVPKGLPIVALSWRLLGDKKPATLTVRPFFSGRGYHDLHHENREFRFDADVLGDTVSWKMYGAVPGVTALASGGFFAEPDWYRNFLYEEERRRGLDHVEDLAAPGTFRFDLERGEAVLFFGAEGEAAGRLVSAPSASALLAELRVSERRRRSSFPTRLDRAADAYLVRRGRGQTVVAGYPWFTDWGRDTFIALRGLTLATGRFDEAREILMEWSHAVSEGMLPNRFQDKGDAPEFNAVDAALWYVVAVHEYLKATAGRRGSQACRECGSKAGCLQAAVLAILEGYAKGTRHGIRMDTDGLLAAGEPGVQLTWMDAKVGNWVVTARIGKPVEIEALWINALEIGALLDAKWRAPRERARKAFAEKFWNEKRGFLADVVDAEHVAGAVDRSFRPNQILAVGGLPFALLDGARARRVVDAVEERLLTPLGLRSLASDEPDYVGSYAGGPRERDGAYHQGTLWPWLIGPFAEAWVRVRGGSVGARAEARDRFLKPLLRHLDEAGIGHISEVADGDAPHRPGGCPFQAWSVSEALRLQRVVLAR